jgi:hypothetical protein
MIRGLRCECCGRNLAACNCEWAEYFVVDRIEDGEPLENGHYETHCATHEEPRR